MQSHASNVSNVATARFEIAFIQVKCSEHRNRFSVTMIAAIDTRNRSRAILCLPKIKSGIAIRLVKIIRETDRFGPIATLSICDPQNPRTSRLIAPIPEPHAQANLHKHGLLRDWQP
jgi:hypothetical protein